MNVNHATDVLHSHESRETEREKDGVRENTCMISIRVYVVLSLRLLIRIHVCRQITEKVVIYFSLC